RGFQRGIEFAVEESDRFAKYFGRASTNNLYILRCDEQSSKVLSSCIRSIKFREFISVVCHAQSFSDFIIPSLLTCSDLEQAKFCITADRTLDNPRALSAAFLQFPKVHKVKLSLEYIRINNQSDPSAEDIAVDDATLMHLVKNCKYTELKFTECSGKGIMEAFEIFRSMIDAGQRSVDVHTTDKFANDLDELAIAHPNMTLHFDSNMRKIFEYKDLKSCLSINHFYINSLRNIRNIEFRSW
ncbi:hypothetical protein PFISCL1PPCAC_20759, partial [Pristionchus fissidentatus]